MNKPKTLPPKTRCVRWMPPTVTPTAATLLPPRLLRGKRGARAPGGVGGRYGISSGVPILEALATWKAAKRRTRTRQAKPTICPTSREPTSEHIAEHKRAEHPLFQASQKQPHETPLETLKTHLMEGFGINPMQAPNPTKTPTTRKPTAPLENNPHRWPPLRAHVNVYTTKGESPCPFFRGTQNSENLRPRRPSRLTEKPRALRQRAEEERRRADAEREHAEEIRRELEAMRSRGFFQRLFGG